MQKQKKLSAKILSIALSAAMVLTMMPATVFAAEGDTAPKAPSGLECHVAHDENCGYKEAVEGVDCSHKNEDGTYSCTSDTVSDNTATPSNADKTVCTHEDGCGYTEAIQGETCKHTCEKCEVKDSGEAEKQPEPTAPKPEDMTFAVPVAATAGNRYEAINIAPGSLNGNTVWGVTEALDKSIRLDTGALFYAKMSDRNSGRGGLPIDGKLTTKKGVPYQFASGSDPTTAYDGDDAIRLTAGKTWQTMDLQTIGAYEKIYVLATAGGPGTGSYAKFQVTLTYTDDSESTTTYNLYDWYDTTPVPDVEQVPGLWRISVDGGGKEYQKDDNVPIMHSATIAADSGKLLKSIKFEMVKQGGIKETDDMSGLYCGIYAVTGAVSANAPDQPEALPATNVNSGDGSPGFTANWRKVEGASEYRLDISKLENFTDLVVGYNNELVTARDNKDGTMSFDVTGLTSNTTYYYRVRAKNDSGQSLSSIRIATDLPQWVKKAGLNSTNATYDVETGTLKLSEGAILTAPLVIPNDGARTLDLNGQTLTAASGQPAIQAADGGKVEFTLKDSTSTPDSPSPTLVGGNGQPAIDFSSAAEGSKVTLSDGASVKGGDGGSANSNGGDGITGSADTEIVMGSGSAATGGSGGAGGNGGNGVTGGIVTIDGNATGGTGGENTAGKGGNGGIGASGNTINGSGTATGGNGGGGSEGNGSGGKGTSKELESGSTLTVNDGVEVSLKDKIGITGLSKPTSNKVYDGKPIENTVFGTATFDPAWSGKLEYTYYRGRATTGTPLVSNPTNAGTYTVVAAIPATDGKFSGKHAPITFTIDAKTVTVTDGALEVKKPYDGTTDAGTANGKLGLIGIETADANNVSVKIDKVGAYVDSNMGKNKTVTLTISLEGTAASNYTLDSATTYSFAKAEITKETYKGTPANAPDSTPENKGDKSITIKPVTPPDGEKVEYAVSKSNTAPTLDSEWQTSTTFDNLAPNTEYFFFARVTENDKHAPGGESAGISITTDKSEYTGKFNKPDGTPESRSHTSITLKTVNPPDGETLEYGIDKDNDGTITWQDSRIFDSLFLNTKYKFYTRVKENNTHKVGTASDATIIRTKKAPTTVSGNVKDSGGVVVDGATVTLTPSNPVITATTANGGNYTLTDVPEGVYSLVIKNGDVTITETVIVAGEPVVVKEMKFLDGNKSTVVASENGAPGIYAGGVNDLLNDTHIEKTLNSTEKTAVDGGGSVELEVKADVVLGTQIDKDKDEIERVANGQMIDLLLDLSVTKTVKDKNGNSVTVTGDEKITELANIIKIHISIPADLQGKDGLRLYRVHDGKAELLQKDYPDANGEYYTIDDSGELMTAYVKNFSTYAMGYNKSTVIVPGGGGGGGSSSSNYYYIKATAGPGGSMSTAEKVKVRAGESASFTITPDKGYQIEDVLVNGKSIGAKNTYEFTKVYSDQTIHATFKKVGDNNPQTGVSFKDVKENDWCYDAIMKATAKGWFSGISATTFSPNAPTTRGMIAAILHRIEGTPKANVTSFNDVAADAYYYANGVAWAEANNIVRGYGNGSYGPNDNITREQLASILYRYASHKGYDLSKTATLDSFTDSKSVSGYAKESMSWAVGSGLISDRGNNALAPTATATRAEVAVILVRFDELFIK